MGMRNLFLSVSRLAFCAAACCAYAADFKVSAWRGETLSVLVPDYTELGESPAGLDVRCGVLRTVRYRPVPSELQVAECYDIVDWSTASGGMLRIAEIKVPRTAKPGLYKWGLMDIEVVDRELLPPSEWKYYLDIWQHPWAVARYAKVKPFSEFRRGQTLALMKSVYAKASARQAGIPEGTDPAGFFDKSILC